MPLIIGTIHMVTDLFVNAYVIERNDHFVLIDTGVESTWKLIRDYLASLDRSLEDISLIIVTHHHGDHTGSLRELRERTGARVAAHLDESQLIRSKTGINADVLLKHGDLIDGFEVIHTPGHTPGHVALLDRASSSLFIGDLAHVEGGELHEIPHHYSMDPEGNRRSIAKLLDYDFDNLMPSHGDPILRIGRMKLEELVKELGIS